MTRRSAARRKAGYALGASGLLIGAPLALSGSASASSTFEGSAAAFGFDYLMKNASIAAGVSPQFAGPVAQADLSSLPSGTSFASFPYPGEMAAGVPGLIPSIVSGLPQTPAYPFIVTSGLGEGQQEINQPGISMRAQTEATDATAHAVLGTDGMGAVSDAAVRVSGDTVVAAAVARQSALSLGSQGEIGSVLSSATVTRGYDGELERVTHLTLSGLRIPGMEFTMPPTTPAPAPVPNAPAFPQAPAPFAGMTFAAPTFGFYDGQFTVQLPGVGPQQYAVNNDAVVSAFKSAGYDVSFTQPIQTKTGVVGATFTLHWIAPGPPDNPLYTGPTDFSVVFGRATASINGDGSAALSGADGAAVGTSATGAASGDPNGVGVPSGVDAAGLNAGAGVLPATDVPSGLTATGAVPTTDLLPSDRVQTMTTRLDIDALSNLYWVLVAAGVIATFSIPTLRVLGVRSR